MNPTGLQLGTALVASFEGCRLIAYKDPGGVWTIGIGHTGPDVVEGLVITQEQSDALFAKDIAFNLGQIPVVMSSTRIAALISFGYNCGYSIMRKAIIDISEINNPIHTTDKHGNIVPGLVTRRRLEYLLATL